MPLKNLEQFKRTLVFEETGTAPELQRAVDDLRTLDKENEAEVKRLTHKVTLVVVGALFSGLVGCLFPPLLVITVGLGIWAATIVGERSKFGRLDTEDRRYELLARLLSLLDADLGQDAQLSVRLDLGRVTDNRKKKGQGSVGVWRVTYYEDPWLDLRGRFVDGTSFRVLSTEHYQARSKTKTSRSGKLKTKSKSKSKTAFAVALKPKAKRYARLAELGQTAMAAVQLPPNVEPKGLSIEEGAAVLKCQTKEPWSAAKPGQPEIARAGSRIVAMMFLSLYQVLNLSRRLTKQAG